MNRAIRSSWIVAAALLTLLLGNMTYIQFFSAGSLKSNELNKRAMLQIYCAERGQILVGGQTIAQSVPSPEGDTCEFVRQYTDGPVYSGITGFFSRDYGKSGIEQAMNDALAGPSSDLFYDQFSQLVSGKQPKGSAVELTLDTKLQKLAHSLLPDDIESDIVISNPKTGEILAMVSKPSYDSNLLSGHNYSEVKNNFDELVKKPNINLYGSEAYRSTSSPGSTFKLIVTAAALASGKYTKDSVLQNPPELNLPEGGKLKNYLNGGCRAKKESGFDFALAQSCNTPFASIAQDLGQQALTEQAEKFGFNQPTLAIPNQPVATSVFPNKEKSTIGADQLARSAIGQEDVRASALEMNMVTNAIAHKGLQMKPNLVKGVRTPELKPVPEFEFKPHELGRSIAPEIAGQLTDWMKGVVTNGIAKDAAVPGLSIAAKTGTAEGDTTNPNSLLNSWFTGFAPAEDPQVSITIHARTKDVKQGAQLTSQNAAKLFKAVFNK